MKQVLLTFDLEEFDTPLEYGAAISAQDQIDISSKGTDIILSLLKKANVQATFFSTVVFATHARDLIARLCNDGHELASHGYFHSSFENKHLLESKVALERLSGKVIEGFRMARMMPVDGQEISKAGYLYNSSLNPTYLPGRYNNFFEQRTVFNSNKVIHVPASVSPIIRIPLFWLSFHNFPLWLYKTILSRTMNNDHYVNIYFHPWEFIDISHSQYSLPGYVTKNSGRKMIERFSNLMLWMKRQQYSFSTIKEFVAQRKIS
jgi:peptidoglycan/xylan/chitin deacetylase (PgdA/CDA1 family)